MKIDGILNAALKAGYVDVTLMSDLPPIGIRGDERGLIPNHEKPLSSVEVAEIIDELVEHKKLKSTHGVPVFPYTDLEHSNYKVSVQNGTAQFDRVSKTPLSNAEIGAKFLV